MNVTCTGMPVSITIVEEMIAGIEQTRLLLLEWEQNMQIMEEQELYN